MTAQTKIRSLALAMAATVMIAAPAAAVAQTYYSQYDADQARYQQQRADYEAARRDYDARYGNGAYDRYYGGPDRYYGASADQAERREERQCHREKSNNAAAGTILGGIAGAVIGSNVAKGGGRTGGAIIGGVGGAALGNTIAKNSTNCDD